MTPLETLAPPLTRLNRILRRNLLHLPKQIGYNIFLSFLGNKKADDDVKSALVPADGGIERFAEDIKEE